MIISISEAAKKFKISRSKVYRMRNSDKISLTKTFDGTTAVDTSEMIRVFGNQTIVQQNNTERTNNDHDIATENFYLKREIEILKQMLEKSEERVDQLISSSCDQNRQLLLTQAKLGESFWHRLFKK